MKKILFVMAVLIQTSVFGQTDEEALNFIRQSWLSGACAMNAHGTFVTRRQFSLEENNSVLVIKVKRDEDIVSSGGYIVFRFKLSEITQIQTFGPSGAERACYNILITTNPMGVEAFVTDNNGTVTVSKEKTIEFYASQGWQIQAIKLASSYPVSEANRVVEAIKWLAREHDADIRNSSF